VSAKPLVSIAILNWNGLEDTKLCLKSIRKLTYDNLEIIVVDNGSNDGSKAYLAEQKDLIFIDLPKNTGFTGGHIAAEKRAKGEYIALINNDLVVDPEWVERCLETFAHHHKAGIVGGKTYRWNDTNPAYDVSNEFYTYQEVDVRTGNTRTLLAGDEERPVDSISGAALMVSRKLIKTVGYLDDTFFAYYEETDLIARALRAGFEAYYTPLAATWHKIGGSSEGGADGAFYLYQMHRNRYLYAAKNFDLKLWRRFKRRYLGEVIKMALRYSRRRDMEARERLRAFGWILRHSGLIKRQRAVTQALGGSYAEHLNVFHSSAVTIVVPCYNYGQFVEEAIESVLDQTTLPRRIIIVNDGSTDNSREVIDRYKNNPLINIHHIKNGGVVAAKNFGLSLVETEWTIFLDADDALEQHYLEYTLKRANDDRLDVVYTDMELFGAENQIFHAPHFNTLTMLHRNYINNSALIKTSLLKQVHGYKQEMHDGLEDWELYVSLIEVGARPGYLPGAMMRYRQHPQTGQLSRNGEVIAKEQMLYERIISLHQQTFRHMSPLRRRFLRLGIFFYQVLRYPGVWIIILKSTRRALIAGLRLIMHEARGYFAYKELH
jgi:GT2 family glycosyltransferase